jgi:hypothetical protein
LPSPHPRRARQLGRHPRKAPWLAYVTSAAFRSNQPYAPGGRTRLGEERSLHRSPLLAHKASNAGTIAGAEHPPKRKDCLDGGGGMTKCSRGGRPWPDGSRSGAGASCMPHFPQVSDLTTGTAASERSILTILRIGSCQAMPSFPENSGRRIISSKRDDFASEHRRPQFCLLSTRAPSCSRTSRRQSELGVKLCPSSRAEPMSARPHKVAEVVAPPRSSAAPAPLSDVSHPREGGALSFNPTKPGKGNVIAKYF